MKTLFTLIALLGLGLNGFAQITWDNSEPPPARGFESEEEIFTYNKVTFAQAGKYRWVRRYDPTCAITTAVCDKVSCWFDTTDSSEFTVDANESFELTAYFYPHDSCCPNGASFDLYMFNIDDPSINSSITFTLDLWCAKLSVNNIKQSDFSLSPNPVNHVLNIASNASIDAVSFTTLVGSTMEIPSLGNGQYDVSELSNGIYLVTITSGNRQFTKRFFKN